MIGKYQGIGLTVEVFAGRERADRFECHAGDLTATILNAPSDGPIRACARVDSKLHSAEFPRLLIREALGHTYQRGGENNHVCIPGFEVAFAVPAEATVEDFAEQLRAVFAKNGWTMR